MSLLFLLFMLILIVSVCLRSTVTILTVGATNLIISTFKIAAILIQSEIHGRIYISSSNSLLILVLHVKVAIITLPITADLERSRSQMRIVSHLS